MTDPRHGIDIAKSALRTSAAAVRDRLPTDLRRQAASRITEIGIGFAAPSAGCTVSGFTALGSEIDAALLLARLTREGFLTCLPVVQPKGNPLVFRAWSPGDPLVPRVWGLREPLDDAPIVEPDVLIVPLLAFDRRGIRLGYGGGYYDRTLALLRQRKPVTAIGLAFPEQEIEAVPAGLFDQPLDWVLTPDGPIHIGNRNSVNAGNAG